MAGAIDSLEKAVALDADYFEAYYQLAQAYLRAGRLAEAQRAIETFEKLKRVARPSSNNLDAPRR